MENIARKFGLQINQEKTKYRILERKNSLKKNKIGHLKIKSYKFEGVENIKYLGVILNEDNNNQTDLQERIKNANKTYCNVAPVPLVTRWAATPQATARHR